MEKNKKQYCVMVKEVEAKYYYVEAAGEEEAKELVEEKYYNGEEEDDYKYLYEEFEVL